MLKFIEHELLEQLLLPKKETFEVIKKNEGNIKVIKLKTQPPLRYYKPLELLFWGKSTKNKHAL